VEFVGKSNEVSLLEETAPESGAAAVAEEVVQETPAGEPDAQTEDAPVLKQQQADETHSGEEPITLKETALPTMASDMGSKDLDAYIVELVRGPQQTEEKEEEPRSAVFRRYLSENGLFDSLTMLLVELYESTDRPSDPFSYCRDFFSKVEGRFIDDYKAENEKLLDKLAVLTAKAEELQKEIQAKEEAEVVKPNRR
jgi:hypothetical protein